MAKYGLTRVRFEGDKTIIVAGAVPDHIAEKAVSMEPVHTPMTPVKHIEKKPNKKATVPHFVVETKPQADVKENESGS